MANSCNQPGWTNATTICFRLVHKPKSFQGAKEECQSLSGSLLTLDKVDEVMTVLGTSMVGNGDNYRIDGWLNATWLEQDNQTLELNTVHSIQTLALNVEDGSVSGSWSDRARLGFVCQRLPVNDSECSDPSDSGSLAENPITRYSCTPDAFLWYYVVNSGSIMRPYPGIGANCECNSFKNSVPEFMKPYDLDSLVVDSYTTPKALYLKDFSDKWSVFYSGQNEWNELVEKEIVGQTFGEPKAAVGTHIIVNDSMSIFMITKARQLNMISFAEAPSSNITSKFQTILPADLEVVGQPVFYEPLGKMFFGGTNTSYLYETFGLEKTWEKVSLPSYEFISSKMYLYACRSTIFALACDGTQCQGNTFEAEKFKKKIDPWAGWTPLPFEFQPSKNFCYQKKIVLRSGETFLTINQTPKVEPERQVRTAPKESDVFLLPADFAECAHEKLG